MNPEMRALLEELAKRKCAIDQEDFNAADYSGENFDDAHQIGYLDGEAHLAQALLAQFGDE